MPGEKGRYITGARARFSLNGVKIGWAQGVTLSETVEYQPAEVLDMVEIDEHVPIRYTVEFTARLFRLYGETLKSHGFFPQAGANSDEHLRNVLLVGEMVATVEDTKTGKTICTVERVKVQSHNWTIDRGTITGEDVTFVAIRIKDESEV